MSRSVMERRRKRIRGRRALRPLVLCGAMLAPALLAVGLLVAELTGYRAVVQGIVAQAEPRNGAEGFEVESRVRNGAEEDGAESGVRNRVEGVGGEEEGVGVEGREGAVGVVPVVPGRGVVMEPRIVPPPYGPDRTYGGLMPPTVVTDVHRSTEEAAPTEAPPAVRRAAPRKSLAPGPRRTPRPERSEAGFGCPAEWRETWLWEVCKEQSRRMA